MERSFNSVEAQWAERENRTNNSGAVRLNVVINGIRSLPRYALCLANHPLQFFRAWIGGTAFGHARQIGQQTVRGDLGGVRTGDEPFAEGGSGGRESHRESGLFQRPGRAVVRNRPFVLAIIARARK